MDGAVSDDLVRERLRECDAVQEPITNASRRALVGQTIDVLVDGVDDDGSLIGRTYREAPEIDGVVRLVSSESGAPFARPGATVAATVRGGAGPDLDAEPVEVTAARVREVAS
jgi:ribosomal protein S12 methylthiotransferase